MTSKWYQYSQNNSGGEWVGPAFERRQVLPGHISSHSSYRVNSFALRIRLRT